MDSRSPYYRLGDTVVPFTPREDLVAVVFETPRAEYGGGPAMGCRCW